MSRLSFIRNNTNWLLLQWSFLTASPLCAKAGVNRNSEFLFGNQCAHTKQPLALAFNFQRPGQEIVCPYRVAIASMSHCSQLTKIPHGSFCVLVSVFFISPKSMFTSLQPTCAWTWYAYSQIHAIPTPCLHKANRSHDFRLIQSTNPSPLAALVCARRRCHWLRYRSLLS